MLSKTRPRWASTTTRVASVLATLQYIRLHRLASRRPLSAYWRYLRWQIASRLRREVDVAWIQGAKFIASNGMTGATGNIYCGLHEFDDMAFVLHLLRPGDLFVDIGANVGSYTILASAVCGATSIAVEPDPGTARHLRRNIAANDVAQHVTVVEAAVGAEPGTVRFTIGRDTTNQVAVGDQRNARTREVEVRRLDDIVGDTEPLLIKIDVEGYEAEVMRGASQTLQAPSLQAILIETVDDGILAALHSAGFKKAGYEPFSRQLAFAGDVEGSVDNNTLMVRDLEFCRARVGTAPMRSIIGQRL